MEIEQRFTLSTAPDAVWQAFQDVRLLVNCLPGASIPDDAAVEGNKVPLLFQVKLGPIAARFKGQGELEQDAAARSGSFSGSAVDGKTQSRVKGVARFALQPDGTGTEVVVAVDYTVTGALAQFSREGIVRALAEQLTREFAANLQAALPAETPMAAEVAARTASAEAALGAPTAVAAVAAPAPASASIDLWSVFKAWLRQWWRGRKNAA